MWGLIDQSPYNNHSTVTDFFTMCGNPTLFLNM